MIKVTKSNGTRKIFLKESDAEIADYYERFQENFIAIKEKWQAAHKRYEETGDPEELAASNYYGQGVVFTKDRVDALKAEIEFRELEYEVIPD